RNHRRQDRLGDQLQHGSPPEVVGGLLVPLRSRGRPGVGSPVARFREKNRRPAANREVGRCVGGREWAEACYLGHAGAGLQPAKVGVVFSPKGWEPSAQGEALGTSAEGYSSPKGWEMAAGCVAPSRSPSGCTASGPVTRGVAPG